MGVSDEARRLIKSAAATKVTTAMTCSTIHQLDLDGDVFDMVRVTALHQLRVARKKTL